MKVYKMPLEVHKASRKRKKCNEEEEAAEEAAGGGQAEADDGPGAEAHSEGVAELDAGSDAPVLAEADVLAGKTGVAEK